jgi:rhodanese-related sulfurtransferase
MLSNGSWLINNDEVLANPGNFFINNKWSTGSWDAYGHFTGAYRIDENLNIANLKNLDPSKTMVTYCYTGQTSAITTAWLQVLGYDNARSLKFGVNAINYTEMKNGSAAAKTWRGEASGSAIGLPYVDSAGVEY